MLGLGWLYWEMVLVCKSIVLTWNVVLRKSRISFIDVMYKFLFPYKYVKIVSRVKKVA